MSSRVFLFIDVDGYCVGGVDQRRVVSAVAEGFRARELGWASYSDGHHAAGAVYFRDISVVSSMAAASADPTVQYARRLHGLPLDPDEKTFAGDHLVVCATRLLEVIRGLVLSISSRMGREVVLVHKGGHEGYWASQVLPDVAVIDLGQHGCPRVDALAKEAPGAVAAEAAACGCRFHADTKRRQVVHCPQLEIRLLAGWVAAADETRLASTSQASTSQASTSEASLAASEPGRQAAPAQ